MQNDQEQKEGSGSASHIRKRALQLLVQAAKPEQRHVFLGTLFLFFAAIFEAVGPWLGKIFIDQYLLPRQFDLMAISLLLMGFLVTGWLATWVRYRQLLRLAGVAMRAVERLRNQVYRHVLNLPISYFDQAITGQLVSRVTNDTEAVKNLYVQVLFVMLDSTIVVIGALIAMAILDWRLMGVALILIPAVIIIVWAYQRLSAPAVVAARQLRSDINAQMAEAIQGMPTLQSAGAVDDFVDRFEKTNSSHFHSRMKEVRANAWLLRPALDFTNVLILIGMLYLFGKASLQGAEVGMMYAFISYLARVVEPLIQITMQFGQIQQAVTSAARVNTLLNEKLALQHGDLNQVSNLNLCIKNVDFSYTKGRTVLHNLNLAFDDGKYYGIVGHTGSGKSTLLSLLLRFYQQDRGEILLDGHPITQYGDEFYRQIIAVVPQEPYILAGTIRENIALGRALSQQEIEAAAQQVDLHASIMDMEQGYDTDIGEQGSRLSSGQKQLLAFARALAGKPRILFLDEATSRIDSETEKRVQIALEKLKGQVTVIAIAHRLSTIRDADKIIVLNHGKLAEQGDHSQLMQIENGLYRRLILLQSMEQNQVEL